MSTFMVNINNFCCACLNSYCSLEPINKLKNESTELLEMLHYLIDKFQDNLSEYYNGNICKNCKENLILSYNFKMQLEENKNIVYFIYNFKLREEKVPNIIEDHINVDDVDHNYEAQPNQMFSSENDDIPNIFVIDDVNVKQDADTEDNLLESSNNNTNDEFRDYLHSHMKHKCITCNILFHTYSAYRSHNQETHLPLNSIHDKGKETIVCPLCGKLILRKRITVHIHNHQNRSYKCTKCDKKFTMEQSLKYHERLHTGDKRHTCEHCGEKFFYWSSKKSHILAYHTGEMTCSCHICDKKFASRSNMHRHIRVWHTQEKPHQCTYCDKRFFTARDKKQHLVVHTKEKKFKCDVCLKTFGVKNSLNSHMKIHTGEKNYICPVCSKAYSHIQVLRSHMKTHPDYTPPPAGTVLSQKFLNRVPNLEKYSLNKKKTENTNNDE